MSELKNEEKDVMEGGFATVDREKLIEQEEKEMVPWYKYFIEAFTAPSKMIGECYGTEPYRGASYGVVGCILFNLINIIIVFSNKVIRQTTIDQLRTAGISEDKLQSTYTVSMVTGIIGSIVMVFFSALIAAVIIQILKSIVKDKASFGNIYKMILISQMVATAVGIIDNGAAALIGQMNGVFQLTTILPMAENAGVFVKALYSQCTLINIISIIWIFIGYKAITHTSTKKAVTVTVLYEVISFLISLGMLQVSVAMTPAV